MTDTTEPTLAEQLAREAELFNRAYAAYRAGHDSKVFTLKLAAYRNDELPHERPSSSRTMVFDQMVREHLIHVPNDLNAIVYHYHQLVNWIPALPKGEDPLDRLLVVREFAECLAHYLLNFPYAITQRFIYSVSHLCHQANRFVQADWTEALLPADHRIDGKVMDRLGKGWQTFDRFKAALALLDDEDFSKATNEFRRKYHHRMPARFELGITQIVTRVHKDGHVHYQMGGTPPIRLDTLLDPLARQYNQALVVYDPYFTLVKELWSAVDRHRTA